jgi:3',5'-cyclic AMP phosphodiesterase CpdA
MKLLAISDLHIGSSFNLAALKLLEAHTDDWLILAGDIGETVDHLKAALEVLVPRFRQVLWVPGNHDLWAIDPDFMPLRGEAKYWRLVEVCRSFDVLTPEDPYPLWPADSDTRIEGAPEIVIAPLFLLYDHSFVPAGVTPQEAIAWASEDGVFCGDEELLDPAPHDSLQAWCAARIQLTERRLSDAAVDGRRLILINHFPLREDLIHLPHMPRLSVWCGTRATENWHKRYNAEAVVYGHLHLPATHLRDGVRFEEVSLGYPQDWERKFGIGSYLRQILPAPTP